MCILLCILCWCTETSKTSHGHGPEDQTMPSRALKSLVHSSEYYVLRIGHECLIQNIYHPLLEYRCCRANRYSEYNSP